MLVCTVFSSEWEYDESVLVLTEENFDKAIEEFPYLLAEFYAPWCGHCKNLAPEYAKAAKHFAEDPTVKLAKVDATVHRTLAERYNVTGFPTMKFFKRGDLMDYNGGRTEQDLIRWIVKKMGDASALVNSMEEVQEKKKTAVVVAYWGPNDENFQTFLKVAE